MLSNKKQVIYKKKKHIKNILILKVNLYNKNKKAIFQDNLLKIIVTHSNYYFYKN